MQKPAAPPMTDAARQQQKKGAGVRPRRRPPYWTGLPSRYPASRYVPQALYHAGVLYTETKKPDEALAAFEELAKKYADSPWAGDAHVWLIDVKLEQQFDLPGARNTPMRRSIGTSTSTGRRLPKPDSISLGAAKTNPTPCVPSSRSATTSTSAPGLVEYLLDHPERAVGFFEKAKPLQPERNFVVVHGHDPHGHRAADRGGQVRQIAHARDRPQGRREGEADPDAGRRLPRGRRMATIPRALYPPH